MNVTDRAVRTTEKEEGAMAQEELSCGEGEAGLRDLGW